MLTLQLKLKEKIIILNAPGAKNIMALKFKIKEEAERFRQTIEIHLKASLASNIPIYTASNIKF